MPATIPHPHYSLSTISTIQVESSYDETGSSKFAGLSNTCRLDLALMHEIYRISPIDSDEKYIRFKHKVDNDFDYAVEELGFTATDGFKQTTHSVLSSLLSMNPDSFNLEITTDKSVFYTLKFKKVTIYVNHFMDVDHDDDNYNCTFVITQNGREIRSHDGNISEVLPILSEAVYEFIGRPIETKRLLYDLSIGDFT